MGEEVRVSAPYRGFKAADKYEILGRTLSVIFLKPRDLIDVYNLFEGVSAVESIRASHQDVKPARELQSSRQL